MHEVIVCSCTTLLCLHARGNFVFMHYMTVCSCVKKIKANSQRPHLLNLWVQHPMHLSVIYTTFLSCIYIENKAALCIHPYGCSKWLYLARVGRMPERELEVIWHGTAIELLLINTVKPSSTQKNMFLGWKPDEYVEPRNMLFKTDSRMQSESWTTGEKVGRGTELYGPFENKTFWQKVEKLRISWPSGRVLQRWCPENMVEIKTFQTGVKDTNLFTGEGNRCCRNHLGWTKKDLNSL